MVLVDNNGKWPTEIHNRIIDKAFPGLTNAQREVLKRASRVVDSLPNQSPEMSYKHAMRAPDQSELKAALYAGLFMAHNAVQARQRQAAKDTRGRLFGGGGLSDSALFFVGQAIHTATDSTSPMHGFKVWRGLIGKDIGESLSLVAGALKHQAGESTITDEQMDEAVADAQKTYRIALGEKLYKNATSNSNSGTSRSLQGYDPHYKGNLGWVPNWSSEGR
jgi:hypothetical protein